MSTEAFAPPIFYFVHETRPFARIDLRVRREKSCLALMNIIASVDADNFSLGDGTNVSPGVRIGATNWRLNPCDATYGHLRIMTIDDKNMPVASIVQGTKAHFLISVFLAIEQLEVRVSNYTVPSQQVDESIEELSRLMRDVKMHGNASPEIQLSLASTLYMAILRMGWERGHNRHDLPPSDEYLWSARTKEYAHGLVTRLMTLGIDPNVIHWPQNIVADNWAPIELFRQIMNGAPEEAMRDMAKHLGRSTTIENGHFVDGLDRTFQTPEKKHTPGSDPISGQTGLAKCTPLSHDDPNAQFDAWNYGTSLLFRAIADGKFAVARILLTHGANPFQTVEHRRMKALLQQGDALVHGCVPSIDYSKRLTVRQSVKTTIDEFDRRAMEVQEELAYVPEARKRRRMDGERVTILKQAEEAKQFLESMPAFPDWPVDRVFEVQTLTGATFVGWLLGEANVQVSECQIDDIWLEGDSEPWDPRTNAIRLRGAIAAESRLFARLKTPQAVTNE